MWSLRSKRRLIDWYLRFGIQRSLLFLANAHDHCRNTQSKVLIFFADSLAWLVSTMTGRDWKRIMIGYSEGGEPVTLSWVPPGIWLYGFL